MHNSKTENVAGQGGLELFRLGIHIPEVTMMCDNTAVLARIGAHLMDTEDPEPTENLLAGPTHRCPRMDLCYSELNRGVGREEGAETMHDTF